MRIKRQRETFALRLAADNPFDPSDNPRKKKDQYGLDIPDVDKERNLHALPEGASSKGFNDAAEAAKRGDGAIGQMQKTPVVPGVSGRGGGGSNSSSGSGETSGENTGGSLLPKTEQYRNRLLQMFPGADIGGWREPDGYNEHSSGHALDFMTTDHDQASKVIQDAFSNGANYAIWNQQMHYPDGRVEGMENRGDATQNHMDHVHINI